MALAAEVFDAIHRLDACTLANAIEATGVRLRNEGYADATVRSLLPDLPPLTGYAFTLQVRTTKPPVPGVRYADSVDWGRSIAALPRPCVLVVQDLDSRPDTGSFMGEVHAHIYRALGCAGVITNGAVRDMPALAAMRFPTFATYVSVSHAYVHLVRAGEPVLVGGLTVRTGDLVHADRHGVIAIPPAVAADLPAIAARQKSDERRIIDYCGAPDFTVEGLDALLRQLQRTHPLPD